MMSHRAQHSARAPAALKSLKNSPNRNGLGSATSEWPCPRLCLCLWPPHPAPLTFPVPFVSRYAERRIGHHPQETTDSFLTTYHSGLPPREGPASSERRCPCLPTALPFAKQFLPRFLISSSRPSYVGREVRPCSPTLQMKK